MSVYFRGKRLPDTYQEVEYIESSGTQWIDTGIYPGTNIQVEAKIELTTTSQNIPVFGCVLDANYRGGEYYHLTPHSNKRCFGLNGSEGNGGTYNAVVGTQYEIVYNNSDSYLEINNSNVISVFGTKGYTGATLGMGLRRDKEGGSLHSYYGIYKYFYFKIYNKTTSQYERNLIPCYRKADSVIGMYDLVNDTFYTNSGTGTFTKGNDVTSIQKELYNAYIGQGIWKPGANTIVYYQFNNNLNDSSGNNKNLSIYSGTPIYGTETGGGKYIYFPNDCWTDYWEDSVVYNNTTLSFYWKGTSSSVSRKPIIEAWCSGYDIYGRVSGNITFEYRVADGQYVSYNAGTSWHYYTLVTGNDNKGKVYIDGQYYGGNTTGTGSGTHTIRFRFNQYGDSNTASNCNTGYLGKVIFESKARTEQEISDYYNLTKSNYGL